jgi:hypothetical protein
MKEEEEVLFGDITCDGGNRRDEKVVCVCMRKGEEEGTSKCHNWGNYIWWTEKNKG